jgi:hypothetical protein
MGSLAALCRCRPANAGQHCCQHRQLNPLAHGIILRRAAAVCKRWSGYFKIRPSVVMISGGCSSK